MSIFSRALGALAIVTSLALTAPLGAQAIELDAQANPQLKAAQMNLAGLGFMFYKDVDGLDGPTTKASLTTFQTYRCLGIDGTVGPETVGALKSLMTTVQQKVGLPSKDQDGQNGETTKQAIMAWQSNNGLVADGMAGGASFAKMGLEYQLKCSTPNPGSNPTKPVAPIMEDSTGVSCAAGSRDLGVHNGGGNGRIVKVRICAITGISSTSDESNPNNRHYIKGANRDLVVSSRVSGSLVAMNAANRNLSATSGFRTHEHQIELCNANAKCRNGNYDDVAKPGTSSHELGLAIDFNVGDNETKGGKSCSTKGRRPNNANYLWLEAHAKDYGFGQYAVEAWHFDPRMDLGRC